MVILASVLLAVCQLGLLFCLGYHYFFLLASVRQSKECLASSSPATRFAIAIPAHNEAAVLSATLRQLQSTGYPAELFAVHVAADHCTDDTAEVVRRNGGTVHERDCPPKGRKAYALRWLLERVLSAEPACDAVAIFDADSLVDPAFLWSADCYLRSGERALQGRHVISNHEDSPLAALAAVDMRLNNRLRNQSRRNLGLSCRLMGDAMVLDAGVLRAYGWLGDSLIEDREYGYELLLHGVRVRYVPEARSHGQAASGWKQAEPQRLRWYRGGANIRRRLASQLLRSGWRSRAVAPLDGAVELVMPSYSTLAAASLLQLGLVIGLGLASTSVRGLLGVTGSALLLAGWVLYPVAGLAVDRAPAWAFKALTLGPVYLLWRLWISLQVRLRGERIAWVRTRRREETDQGPP